MSEESGEEFGAVGASFLAAKGFTKELDLLPTESGDKKYLAFLNAGWGMIRSAYPVRSAPLIYLPAIATPV